MQFLFVHQNFPGQYLHLIRRLAHDERHEVTFLSHPNSNQISGVRKVHYRPVQASAPGIFPNAREIEAALIRAESAASMARQLARIGYKPDIIFGHNGWGEVLNLKDVWPTVPLVPYFEFYYHERGLDVDFDPEFPVPETARAGIRARNAVNLLGLAVADLGQTPTAFQRSTYPEWTRGRLEILPEGVDLNVCRPSGSASFDLPRQTRRWRRRRSASSSADRLLITFVARNLEPYRGFHIFMRALPDILSARKDVDAVIVGGDEVSYGSFPPGPGTWRERLLAELGSRLSPDRVFFPGKLAYGDYVRLLQVSAVHVYLTYPFVASWSLREAMACGCALVASDTEAGPTTLYGGGSGSLLYAGDGSSDVLYAGVGNQTLSGALSSNGNTFHAGNEFTLVEGGAGNDTIIAGSGSETLFGGGGKNLFELFGGTTSPGTYISIGDFKVGADRLVTGSDLGANLDSVYSNRTVAGGSTTLTLGDGTTIVLTGVTNLDRGSLSSP